MRKAKLIVLGILLPVIVFGIIILTNKIVEDIYEEQFETFVYEYIVETYTQIIEPITQEEIVEPEEIEERITIDWYGLRERNADIVGWIIIPETRVNYPIVQARDNRYYLHRDFDGNRSSAGTIFLDYLNCLETGRVNILYGHNFSRRETKFSQLRYYAELEFFTTHPTVLIITPDDSVTAWQILAFARVDTHNSAQTNALYRTDIIDIADHEQFMEAIRNNAIQLNEELMQSIMYGDRILTLSTCTQDGNSHHRFVVFAVNKERN